GTSKSNLLAPVAISWAANSGMFGGLGCRGIKQVLRFRRQASAVSQTRLLTGSCGYTGQSCFFAVLSG
ncbi:MAG: hypothetical protein M1157_03675, partial [Deinococcus sp.]|nr:hypothetical protein [Deinococcus sp.]